MSACQIVSRVNIVINSRYLPQPFDDIPAQTSPRRETDRRSADCLSRAEPPHRHPSIQLAGRELLSSNFDGTEASANTLIMC